MIRPDFQSQAAALVKQILERTPGTIIQTRETALLITPDPFKHFSLLENELAVYQSWCRGGRQWVLKPD
jgi:hypothetical protein